MSSCRIRRVGSSYVLATTFLNEIYYLHIVLGEVVAIKLRLITRSFLVEGFMQIQN